MIRDYDLYLMIIPGIIWYIIFYYIPMYGITISFQQFNIMDGFFGSKWVGLKHYIDFVKDPYFPRIIRNTLMLGLYRLLWGFWPSILLALLLNEIRSALFKRTVQSISYLPHFISTVVIVGIMFNLFKTKGIVNNILESMGFGIQDFINDPGWFRTLYTGSGVWQGVGWGTIIYLAAIAGLNVELYESAVVEGANRLHRAIYITLPGMLPTITILFIFALKDIIAVGFDKVYLMTNGNPALYETSDVIATYVYRRGIEFQQFSFSAAVGVFNNVISLILLVITNYFAKKYTETSLW